MSKDWLDGVANSHYRVRTSTLSRGMITGNSGSRVKLFEKVMEHKVLGAKVI